jgi:Ca2+/Na+ antiporter
MQSPTAIKRTAREAGLLYLAMSILAIIGYFFLHRQFFISGDPAATARSILANEQLYRISLLLDLVTQVLFILVVLALYRLFEDVDRTQARAMVALVGTGIAAGFAGFVFNAAPLLLLGGSQYLSVFSQQQLEALSYASLSLLGKQGQLLTSLWGLWLFPFAVLTIKSGFLPKFLGVLLIITGIAYVVSSVTAIAFPEYAGTIQKFAMPLYFGEFIVVLWLAIVGAKPRTVEP